VNDDDRQPRVVVASVDPRLFDAIVDFTGEVADVAATLLNIGRRAEGNLLLRALDRLDAAGRDDDDAPPA
jgi:hypothetical protein